MINSIISPTIWIINLTRRMGKDLIPTFFIVNLTRKIWKFFFPTSSIIDVTRKSRYFIFPTFLITNLATNGVFELVFPALNVSNSTFIVEIRKNTHFSGNSKE